MYKTTKEENEILTKVGPGTPGGEMLRRYWWPVGISGELTTKPTFIRLLGEDLVLFRDGTGRPGVLGAYCARISARQSLPWGCGEGRIEVSLPQVVIRCYRQGYLRTQGNRRKN